MTTVLSSAASSGELPDVIGALSLPIVNQLRTDDLLDTEAAAAVVDELGADTFAERALTLTRDGDTQLAVPSDGWAQLLYYRKDLFAAAGLEPPTSYAAIQAAAERLDQGDVAGIAASTTPADAFTHQTFEHLALANGCQLVDDSGEPALESDECVEAFRFAATPALGFRAGQRPPHRLSGHAAHQHCRAVYRGLHPVQLTRGLRGSGRGCVPVAGLELDRGSPAEAGLAASTVIGAFDPGKPLRRRVFTNFLDRN